MAQPPQVRRALPGDRGRASDRDRGPAGRARRGRPVHGPRGESSIAPVRSALARSTSRSSAETGAPFTFAGESKDQNARSYWRTPKGGPFVPSWRAAPLHLQIAGEVRTIDLYGEAFDPVIRPAHFPARASPERFEPMVEQAHQAATGFVTKGPPFGVRQYDQRSDLCSPGKRKQYPSPRSNVRLTERAPKPAVEVPAGP